MPVGDPNIRRMLNKLYSEVDKTFNAELEKRLKKAGKLSHRKPKRAGAAKSGN